MFSDAPRMPDPLHRSKRFLGESIEVVPWVESVDEVVLRADDRTGGDCGVILVIHAFALKQYG